MRPIYIRVIYISPSLNFSVMSHVRAKTPVASHVRRSASSGSSGTRGRSVPAEMTPIMDVSDRSRSTPEHSTPGDHTLNDLVSQLSFSKMDVEEDITVNATQNNATQAAFQQNVDNSSSSTHFTQNNLLVDNSVSADAGVAHVAMQATTGAANIVASAASEVAAHASEAASAKAQAEATKFVAEERIKDVERQAKTDKAATLAAAEHALREERAASAARQSDLEAKANAEIAKNYQYCLQAVEEARAGSQKALDASARTERKVDEIKDSIASISSTIAPIRHILALS